MCCSHVYHYKTVHIMMKKNLTAYENSGYTFFILCGRNRIISPLAGTHPERKHHHSTRLKNTTAACVRSALIPAGLSHLSPPHLLPRCSPQLCSPKPPSIFLFLTSPPKPPPCCCFPRRSLGAVYPGKIKPLLRRSHCCYTSNPYVYKV